MYLLLVEDDLNLGNALVKVLKHQCGRGSSAHCSEEYL